MTGLHPYAAETADGWPIAAAAPEGCGDLIRRYLEANLLHPLLLRKTLSTSCRELRSDRVIKGYEYRYELHRRVNAPGALGVRINLKAIISPSQSMHGAIDYVGY